MLYNKYWSLWMFLCHGLIPVMGQSHCLKPCEPRKLNLTVTLNSDVLLPCVFNVSLLQKARSMLAAVWTHGPTYLVELNTLGEPRFWNHKEHRVNIIKSPQKGNFSIFIKLVQESDQGLYCCELFDGQNCSMGCEEVQLSLQRAPPGDTRMGLVVKHWYYTAAGGAVFILLILGCACGVWHRCVKVQRTRSGNSTIDWVNNDFYGKISYNQGQHSQQTECCHTSSSRKPEKGNGQEMSSI